MPSKRLELTVSQELWDRVESARGEVPRAKWVKLALEAFLAPRVDAETFARAAGSSAVDPRPVPSVDPRAGRKPKPYAEFVVASSLVTPKIKSEWDEIMAARQARLNKHRDGAA